MDFSPRHIAALLLHNNSFKQTIFKNTFWLAAAEVVEKVTLFFITIWLVRYFGPAGYGKWAFATNLVGIFVMMADFGLGNYAVREIARDKDGASRYIDNIVAVKAILGLASFALLVLVSRFLGKEAAVLQLLYVMGLYALISSFSSFFHSIFRANQQMQYETLCRIVQIFLLLTFVAVAMYTRRSLIAIGLAYMLSAMLGLLFPLAFVRRYFARFFLRIDWRFCLEIIKEVWPLGLAFVFIMGYHNTDTVMLSLMKNDADVGWYSAAYKFLMFLLVLPAILQASFYPGMSHSFAVSKDRFGYVYDRFLKTIFITVVPVCVFMILNAGRVTALFYGPEFLPAAKVLRILMWSFLFASVGGVLGNVLLSCDKQKTLMYVTGTAFAGNILLNYIWIPKFGYVGASHATNLTRLFVIVVEFYLIAKMGYVLPIRDYMKIGAKVAFAVSVMVCAIVFLGDISFIGATALAVVAYPCALYVVKGFKF